MKKTTSLIIITLLLTTNVVCRADSGIQKNTIHKTEADYIAALKLITPMVSEAKAQLCKTASPKKEKNICLRAVEVSGFVCLQKEPLKPKKNMQVALYKIGNCIQNNFTSGMLYERSLK